MSIKNRFLDDFSLKIEWLLYLSLFLFAIKHGVTAPVPDELVYKMGPWNDAIGIVTKSLNHSQEFLGYFGVERFSDPPEPIGGTWVGPARRLPYTVIFVVATPLFSETYIQAFQTAYTLGFLFTTVVAYPVTGYVVHKLVTAVSSRKAGLVAVFGFLGQQIVGWPGQPLYNLKFQHAMANTVCLVALYFAILTIQADDQDKRSRNAVLAGATLGFSGLMAYNATLITILSVFFAFIIQQMWGSLVRTGVTGMGFATFYIIVPEAGQKVIDKAGGRAGGETAFAIGRVVNAILTPGIILIILISLSLFALFWITGRPMVDGYLIEVSIVLCWLLWFITNIVYISDNNSISFRWFLQILFLLAFSYYLWEMLEDKWLEFSHEYDIDGNSIALVAWLVMTVMLLGIAPLDGPNWLSGLP